MSIPLPSRTKIPDLVALQLLTEIIPAPILRRRLPAGGMAAYGQYVTEQQQAYPASPPQQGYPAPAKPQAAEYARPLSPPTSAGLYSSPTTPAANPGYPAAPSAYPAGYPCELSGKQLFEIVQAQRLRCFSSAKATAGLNWS
jgi:hypothetical protein